MLVRPTVISGLTRLALARLRRTGCWASVTLLLTLRCDGRCRYCDFPRHAGAEMPTSDVLALLAGLRRGGTFRLGLSGGEPLLREDLGVILAGAAESGFITSLVTNGLALAERIGEFDRLDYLFCTIEGDAPTHDRMRGHGSFDRVVAGLTAACGRRSWRMGVICPVHRDNRGVLEEPLRLARDLGARVFYQPVQIRDGWRGRRFPGALDDPEIREVGRLLLNWKRAGRPVGNSRGYLERLAAGPPRLKPEECLAGRYFATILPDGRWLPCCMLSFDRHAVPLDPDRPRAPERRDTPPACAGCSIAPYFENTHLLSFAPGSVLNLVSSLLPRRGI